MNTLRRAFTSLVRWAFSDPSKMADYGEALECYTYKGAGADNTLNIAPSSTIDPGDTQNVPGILISLGQGVQYTHPAMQPYINEAPDTSEISLTSIASADITILCRDKDADVCCMMGDLCTLFLFAMTERLYNTWSWLRTYQIQGQTEPKITQAEGGTDDTKWYESTITIKIEYEYSVFTARESKRMKDFSLEAEGEGMVP